MNCQAVAEAEKNMVFAARLTQQGHKIASMDDLMELYEKSFSVQTVAAMGALPHPTIQKFAVITVAIVCASRRFLAQITRHQNEVKFMSASLQYSNYTGQADFAVPYSIMTAPAVVRELYLKSCNESMECYETLCTAGSRSEPCALPEAGTMRPAMPRPRDYGMYCSSAPPLISGNISSASGYAGEIQMKQGSCC